MARHRNNEYSPNFKDEIKMHHRITLMVVSIFMLLLGLEMLIGTILLKNEHADIPTELFIVWAGAPVVICAIFGFIAGITKQKYFVSIFLLLSLFTVVLVTFAVANNGFIYWSENWPFIKREADRCSDNNADNCPCVVDALQPDATSPFKPYESYKCRRLEKIADMLVAQIAVSAVSTLSLIMGCFVSMVIICCGPWQYVGDPRPEKKYNSAYN